MSRIQFQWLRNGQSVHIVSLKILARARRVQFRVSRLRVCVYSPLQQSTTPSSQQHIHPTNNIVFACLSIIFQLYTDVFVRCTHVNIHILYQNRNSDPQKCVRSAWLEFEFCGLCNHTRTA